MTDHDNVKEAIPFFAVSNIDESLRYYVDGLGCKTMERWVVEGQLRWCHLQNGSAGLMLQEFPREGHDSRVPECNVGEGVSVYFVCKDALAIYRDLRARGIDASTPVVGNRMWVTSLKDPDGYRLHFESETDVAEGTEYSAKVHDL